MREWFFRLIDWFRRPVLERELDEELRFHRQQLERAALASGASAQDAASSARRRLGDDLRVKEETRERWSIQVLDNLRHDIRYALRGLGRSPGFTATVIVTLALGIGANATMFGVVDRLMFRPLGLLREPGTANRIYLQWNDREREITSTSMAYARYLHLQRWTTSFSALAGFAERTVAIGVGDAARERQVGAVSAAFFEFFRAAPVQGRYFTADEDVAPRGADVVVLSHAFWQAEFGGRYVLGELLQVGNISARIIGVAPPGLTGVNDANPPAVFVPLTTFGAAQNYYEPARYDSDYNRMWVHVLARRAPGVSVERASGDVTQAFVRSWTAEPEAGVDATRLAGARPRALVSSIRTGAGPDPMLEARTALWVSGVALIVLLIACANVANLFLGRALRRMRETSVRLALGVTRSRLLTQALTESLVLALLGATAGLLCAHWGGSAIRNMLLPQGAPAIDTFTDGRTLTVALTLALAVALLTGSAPVFLVRRGAAAQALRGGTRGGMLQPTRVRTALLVVQAALSVVLLVGATLFVRSLSAVKAIPLGYDAEQVLMVRRVFRGARPDQATRIALRRNLLETAARLPNVEGAAWMSTVPLGMTGAIRIAVPGVDSLETLGQFTYQGTTADYFRVMRTRILRGRSVPEGLRPGLPIEVVVSEGMAKVLWPGGDAIGQCIQIGGGRGGPPPCSTVVGVAEDMVQDNLTSSQRYSWYMSVEQEPIEQGSGLLVRVRGDPAVEGESIRRALQQVMPGESYVTVQPLQENVDRARRSWQLGATLFTVFGGLALLIAAVGLYGVIAYNVAQRMHELGVRMALGARRAHIVQLVASQSVRIALTGTALGIMVALWVGRWLQPLLFEQSAKDPLGLAVAAALMVLVALAASAIPAARASRADPNLALRSD